MKQFLLKIFILILLVTTILALFNMRKMTEKKTYVTLDVDYLTILKQDLFSLMMAYPHDIFDIEIENKHTVYLILKSGEKLLYDDLKNKTETEKLQNPDLQDMMSELYLLGPVNGLMPENYNPGRIRVYPLLKEVYGTNQVEIEKNLTGVRVNSSYHRFNSNNSASLHLNQALDELTHLLKDAPHLWAYLHPIGGTYNFRYISNTNRLSPHSFGISIDLAIHKDDYWQWTSRKAGEKRLMSYPQEIVDVMEKHYFIWGGKWGLFDTLHFEYRPEIIIKGKYFNSQPQTQTLWYEKLPVKEEKVTNIILLIEERLKDFIMLFSFHL